MNETFAQILQRFRKQAGLIQDDLAEKSHVSVSQISRLERDDTIKNSPTVISYHILEALANGLGLSEDSPERRQFFEAAAERNRQRQAERSGITPPTRPAKSAPEIDGPRKLSVGGLVIDWIILQQSHYISERIRCVYDDRPIPLEPDFARLKQELILDCKKRLEAGEKQAPYNSGMYKLKTFDVGYREINEAGEEIPILLKCCSNFGAIPIIDNKTIGCEPKEAEKPEIAGPGS